MKEFRVAEGLATWWDLEEWEQEEPIVALYTDGLILFARESYPRLAELPQLQDSATVGRSSVYIFRAPSPEMMVDMLVMTLDKATVWYRDNREADCNDLDSFLALNDKWFEEHQKNQGEPS
jgi:hypothetical protein